MRQQPMIKIKNNFILTINSNKILKHWKMWEEQKIFEYDWLAELIKMYPTDALVSCLSAGTNKFKYLYLFVKTSLCFKVLHILTLWYCHLYTYYDFQLI